MGEKEPSFDWTLPISRTTELIFASYWRFDSGPPPPPQADAPSTSSAARARHARFMGARVRRGPVSPYTHHVAQAPAFPGGFELPLEPRLPRIGSVDEVGVEERAAALAKRSIKKDSKLYALELAIRMMDLTTLEGADTPG